jgi:hypothetical protein
MKTLSPTPTVKAIKNILDSSCEQKSLYQLIVEIQLYKMDGLAENTDVKWFQQNFIVMNALYQLTDIYVKESKKLCISAIAIYVMPTTVSSAITVLNNAGDAKLKNYYLDWTNYKNTNAQDVYNLLNAFWQRYSHSRYNNEDKALADLGLANKAKQKEITQQYKKLANQYHPDKGGDEQQFIKIKKAYDALKTEFTKEKHIEIIN